MKVNTSSSFKKRTKSDLLLLPFWFKDEKAVLASKENIAYPELKIPIKLGDFHGKEGESLLLYVDEAIEKRVFLLGLGEEKNATEETFRKAAAAFVEKVSTLNVETVAILSPSHSKIPQDKAETAFLEGLLLANYAFFHYKKPPKDKKRLKEATFLNSVLDKTSLARTEKIQEAVFFARDLVIKSADEVTPSFLADKAHALSKTYSALSVKVLGASHSNTLNMGLLLAVSRGASEEPKCITISYKGNPRSKEHTALIGKGITFDTGGLNLKPTGGIENMRCDMAGGAAAMGLMKALAALKIKVNVTAVIPSAENSISSNSYKPGDVYTSLSGKTIEITNTDAEGRLILADAITYAIRHFKPTRIIDLATLTGAIIVALGNEVSGLFCNNDHLAHSLMKAGDETHERLWRMPLHKEYRKALDSEVADLVNSGGRPASSVTAALFLQEFVENIPWAHIDIAGTAALPAKKDYLPKQGTGVMVRLLTRFFQNEEKK